MKNIIYKICSRKEWQEAERAGSYKGSIDDLRDGFIHFSSKDQVEGTLNKHFSGQKNLLLVDIDTNLLPEGALKWEVSRNGEKFPHLYNDLHLDAVINVKEIPDKR